MADRMAAAQRIIAGTLTLRIVGASQLALPILAGDTLAAGRAWERYPQRAEHGMNMARR